jgi:hypothetical protein
MLDIILYRMRLLKIFFLVSLLPLGRTLAEAEYHPVAARPERGPVYTDEDVYYDPIELGKHFELFMSEIDVGGAETTLTYCGVVEDIKALEAMNLDGGDAMLRPAYYVHGDRALWAYLWLPYFGDPWWVRIGGFSR